MNGCIYRLTVPLVFEHGLVPGAGSSSNRLTIAFNGIGAPVLHGSAIAGVLRHAYEDLKKKELAVEEIKKEAARWFGEELNNNTGKPSRVKISDAVFKAEVHFISLRTHNMINRHTGAAVEGGLFSIESLPPGSNTILQMEIDGRACTVTDCENFIRQLTNLFEEGLFFGGSSNRGVGLATAREGIYVRRFNTNNVNDFASLLDARYSGKKKTEDYKKNMDVVKGENQSDDFHIKLTLGIPRGEDLLVGDGQTMDYILEPQKVTAVDGREYWRIPGSAFRGVFRAWMTRLAARDALLRNEENTIRDSFMFYNGDDNTNIPCNSDEYTGEMFGYAFIRDVAERDRLIKEPDKLGDPIYSLFGSMYKKGRIHFADSRSHKCRDAEDDEERAHIAIDRFTGGVIEGALFANKVLRNTTTEFLLSIKIDTPQPNELKWLRKTLKALHLGIISIGSGKSSGRLAIKRIVGCSDAHFQTNMKSFLEEHKQV